MRVWMIDPAAKPTSATIHRGRAAAEI